MTVARPIITTIYFKDDSYGKLCNFRLGTSTAIQHDIKVIDL